MSGGEGGRERGRGREREGERENYCLTFKYCSFWPHLFGGAGSLCAWIHWIQR